MWNITNCNHDCTLLLISQYKLFFYTDIDKVDIFSFLKQQYQTIIFLYSLKNRFYENMLMHLYADFYRYISLSSVIFDAGEILFNKS